MNDTKGMTLGLTTLRAEKCAAVVETFYLMTIDIATWNIERFIFIWRMSAVPTKIEVKCVEKI